MRRIDLYMYTIVNYYRKNRSLIKSWSILYSYIYIHVSPRSK